MQHPEQEIKIEADNNNKLTAQLNRSMKQLFTSSERELQTAINKLALVNPLAIMARGYGISYNQEGNVIKSIKEVNQGDQIDVRLKDGYVQAEVQKIKEADDSGGRKEI